MELELSMLPLAELRAKLDELDVAAAAILSGRAIAYDVVVAIPALVALARHLTAERPPIEFEEGETIVRVYRGDGAWQRFVAKDQYNSVRAERDAAVAERDRLKAAMQSASKNAEARREEHARRWKEVGDSYSQGYSDAADVLFQPIDDALTPWAARNVQADVASPSPAATECDRAIETLEAIKRERDGAS